MDFEDHGDSGRNYSCNDYVVMWMNQKMKTEEKLSICREGRMRINEEIAELRAMQKQRNLSKSTLNRSTTKRRKRTKKPQALVDSTSMGVSSTQMPSVAQARLDATTTGRLDELDKVLQAGGVKGKSRLAQSYQSEESSDLAASLSVLEIASATHKPDTNSKVKLVTVSAGNSLISSTSVGSYSPNTSLAMTNSVASTSSTVMTEQYDTVRGENYYTSGRWGRKCDWEDRSNGLRFAHPDRKKNAERFKRWVDQAIDKDPFFPNPSKF